MTPADEARALVEGWSLRWGGLTSLNYDTVLDLIARLTPVFERAQATGVRLEPDGPVFSTGALLQQVTDLRERAERAEAQLQDSTNLRRAYDIAIGRAERAEAKLADSMAYCSGEWPCEASTSAASLELRLNLARLALAEKDRALERIANAIKFAVDHDEAVITLWSHWEAARQALVAGKGEG